MAQTLYLRTGTGSCGAGTQRLMTSSAGTTNQSQSLTGEHSWNFTESARTIASGTWTVLVDLTTGSGGGAPNRVTVVVERVNSSCTVQTTLLSVEQTMNAGTTEEVTFEATGVAAETFASGDIIVVRAVRSNGGRTQALQFNNAAGGDYDSRLIYPDEEVAGNPVKDMISRGVIPFGR